MFDYFRSVIFGSVVNVNDVEVIILLLEYRVEVSEDVVRLIVLVTGYDDAEG